MGGKGYRKKIVKIRDIKLKRDPLTGHIMTTLKYLKLSYTS